MHDQPCPVCRHGPRVSARNKSVLFSARPEKYLGPRYHPSRCRRASSFLITADQSVQVKGNPTGEIYQAIFSAGLKSDNTFVPFIFFERFTFYYLFEKSVTFISITHTAKHVELHDRTCFSLRTQSLDASYITIHRAAHCRLEC